jgi:hypothetical protein
MSGGYLLGSEVLLDDREARAVTVAWAVSAYPAVVTRRVKAVEVAPVLNDPFETDEAVAARLICELSGGSAATVEVPLVSRLIAERRYGQRLYREVFGRAPEFWTGGSALEMIRARTGGLPMGGPAIVVSPRSRLELMLGLLGAGWSSQLSGVVSADDVSNSQLLADELLSEGSRRLALLGEPSDSVRLVTRSDTLRRAGEERGFVAA